jgi:hypothetical protein
MTTNDPTTTKVECHLTGQDGNAFAVMGRVARALRQAGADQAEIDMYFQACRAGDYDNLLRVSMATLDEHGVEWN